MGCWEGICVGFGWHFLCLCSFFLRLVNFFWCGRMGWLGGMVGWLEVGVGGIGWVGRLVGWWEGMDNE